MDQSKPTHVFSQRLKEAMEDAGLGTSALGEKLGVSKQTVHKWLNSSAFPSAANLNNLVSVLGRPIGWYFSERTLPGHLKVDLRGVTQKLREVTETLEKLSEETSQGSG